jgi:hypothetical protein
MSGREGFACSSVYCASDRTCDLRPSCRLNVRKRVAFAWLQYVSGRERDSSAVVETTYKKRRRNPVHSLYLIFENEKINVCNRYHVRRKG